MAKRSLRIEYGKYLAELGAVREDLIVLESDLKASTQSIQFQNRFPDRYFDIGVAEQNMVGIAAGLALSGKLPVAHSFACFMSMRACEQIRTTIAYPNLNVKLVVSHAGISAGSAGTTHHSTEDIAIMRSFANMVVLVPGDAAELRQVVDAALTYVGPTYIRIGAGEAEDVYGPEDRFAICKATELRQGDNAAIITTGTMVYEGICAADLLRKEYGLDVRVLQMASVKPLDVAAIQKAARETKHIVTVEEHSIIGGLGSAVCEVVAELGQAKVKRIGIQDRYSGIGTATYLMKREGLFTEHIAEVTRALVDRQ